MRDLACFLCGVVVAAIVFIRMAKHAIARDAFAPELLDRPLDFYQQVDRAPDTTMPPAVTGRRHQKSRIAGQAATTNSNASSRV
jgi:hypothetical protein